MLISKWSMKSKYSKTLAIIEDIVNIQANVGEGVSADVELNAAVMVKEVDIIEETVDVDRNEANFDMVATRIIVNIGPRKVVELDSGLAGVDVDSEVGNIGVDVTIKKRNVQVETIVANGD